MVVLDLAEDPVVSVVAVKRVSAATAQERVVSGSSECLPRAGPLLDQVIARLAEKPVPARSARDEVIAVAGADDVLVALGDDRVISPTGDDHLGTVLGHIDHIVAIAANDGGLASAAGWLGLHLDRGQSEGGHRHPYRQGGSCNGGLQVSPETRQRCRGHP
jgi:hypothetical protein